MKKSVLVVALAIGVTAAFAQDLTSKKGEKYLPEAHPHRGQYLKSADLSGSWRGDRAVSWHHGVCVCARPAAGFLAASVHGTGRTHP